MNLQDLVSKEMDIDAAVAAGATRALEPWCNVPYCHEQVSPEQLARWESPAPSPLLALPPKNEYIPRDFSLRGEAAEAAEPSGRGGAAAAAADRVPPPKLLLANDRHAHRE